jgi:hypothetical protein
MRQSDHDEFYIGYDPSMPPRTARFVTRALVVVGALAAVTAVLVAVGHKSLEAGSFEYGHPTSIAGTLLERPYPTLIPEGARSGEASVLLVAPGKHGADRLVQGLDGRRATVTGTRIRRGSLTMVEVEPASLATHTTRSGIGPRVSEGLVTDTPVTLTGEIVDSKCFLGVMVPGSGKTHKECASLCLRGGIPPALYVHDRGGRSSLLLLTGPSGERVSAQAASLAGEAVTISGTLAKQGGWLVIRSDPSSWRPVTR